MDKSKLAMAGLICGCVAILLTILGFFLFFCAFLAPIASIAAIILGGMGLKKEDGSTNGMGIAALIMGIVFLVIDIPIFICGVCACQLLCAGEAVLNDIANELNNINW